MKRIECHVIAGVGGPFTAHGTKALDQLFDDLSPLWDATHWYHRSWEKCANGILARRQRFNDWPIVILIGHSYGALRIQQIATRLYSNEMHVSYMGGIDPTALPAKHPPMVIPPNVIDVDEFWSTTWFPFNMPYIRRKTNPDGKKGGKYIYSAGFSGSKHIHRIQGGHIACASNPKTRGIILEKVEGLVG